MSQAVMGTTLLVVAGIGVAAMTGGLGTIGEVAMMDLVGTASSETTLVAGVAVAGAAMEAGAIASALSGNRGMDVTTREAAAYRQIIYGQQRVGGTVIYRSTTGSHKDQYNYVIVLAGHEIDSIVNLYLDGRQVIWQGANPNFPSAGYAVRNGYGFGGEAAGGSYEGPDGQRYSFNSVVFAVAYYGDQADQTVCGNLTANDPTWAADGNGGYPWVGGCAYVYLKIEADPTTFPKEPSIRFTINGKNDLLDPRQPAVNGVPYRGFSNNWALIANDIITDPVFGLGDPTVNQAQLIAAANVSDEQVPLAIGGTEARYTCNTHYDTGTSPGTALASIMTGAAGRLSRIGGEWYLWPAYWQGPSFSFTDSNLTGPLEWKSTRSYRDLINRVNGTYTAPTFPWNVAGNLYDQNGFYYNDFQNNFPFAWHRTNFPQYACDTLHGYTTDSFLAQDGGKQLPMELNLDSVISVAQCQRVAKILLLRNRQQGTGHFHLNLDCWQMQPVDCFYFTYGAAGWNNKLLEVSAVKFVVSPGHSGTPPTVRAEFGVNETDSSVYEWSTTEELTVYDIAAATPTQFTLAPVTPPNLTLVSSSATAVISPDGIVTPRIEVQWGPILDGTAIAVDIQYQEVGGSGIWIAGPSVSSTLNSAYISGVVAGQQYTVQARTRRPNGAVSLWAGPVTITAGLVLSVVSQAGYGPGTLVGEGFSDGTAAIVCEPFTALVGQQKLSIFPGGPVTVTTDGTIGGTGGSLAQQTLYYVYYQDPNYLGGNVTPIATTNLTDFSGKIGYFLIDSIVTPYGGSGGTSGATRYAPTAFSDTGSRTTTNPTYAYDNNLSTSASVSGSATSVYIAGSPNKQTTSYGNCTWSGFTNYTAPAAMTLNVTLSAADGISPTADANNTLGTVTVTPYIGGTAGTATVINTPQATETITFAIPSGTNLSSVTLNVSAQPGTALADSTYTSASSNVSAQIIEIFIN